ncbi:hypothetical protein [Rhizobium sp. PP-CC-3G-465]|uniref:hypothetical protein n=1 Tax=Rhizobium sp. PP-CC-3G-465 TaxID=2135648 RepID=UPI001A9EB6D4
MGKQQRIFESPHVGLELLTLRAHYVFRGNQREETMTASDIERLEQAARSVFGHDDGDTLIVEEHQSFTDRLRAFFQKRLPARLTSAPSV